MRIRIVLGDDSLIVREGLERLLSADADVEVVAAVGDRAYLLKDRVHDSAQLNGAVRAVASGGSVVDPSVFEALLFARTRSERSPLNELTPRERDVLREIAQAKRVKATLMLLAEDDS